MIPAKRAKRLQAHSLRCQGLTYRQIGERMHCAHSTAAQYVRDFEAHRAEIIESLAADLLVHSVANLQTPDPDLHAQHINAARELRLLVNSLDEVEDRRQKRARRVAMEEEADALKNIQVLEELLVTMHENGIDDLTPYLTDPEAFRTEHFTQPLPSPNPAEQDAASTPLSPRAADGSLPRTRCGDAEGRGGSPAFASPTTVNPTPTKPVQPQPKPDQQPTKPAQNRPKSNKSERKSRNRPPVQAPPRPKRKTPHPQFPIPDPLPPPNNRRELAPDDPLVRRLFRNW